jgi:Domain of unknown function (DUF4192)
MKNPRLISSPSDLLIAIPFLLGFTPSNSIVVVSIKDQIVEMTMRSDFPPEIKYSEVADELLAQLGAHKAQEILLVAYLPPELEFDAHFLKELFIDLNKSIPVRDFVAVSGDRWRSLSCVDDECCPIQGRALPEISTSLLAVEEVAAGNPMPLQSEDELIASIAFTPSTWDEGFTEAIDQHWSYLQSLGQKESSKAGVASLLKLISEFSAKGYAQDRQAVVEVFAALADIQVRDFAIGAHGQELLLTHWSMWRWLLRMAPEANVAPVSSIFAILSYERGDGALAHRALDRALANDSQYSLALLLRRTFSAGWPPEAFSKMRAELHPKIRDEILGAA